MRNWRWFPEPHVGHMTCTHLPHRTTSTRPWYGKSTAEDYSKVRSKNVQPRTVETPEAVLNSMNDELSSGMQCFPGIRRACLNPLRRRRKSIPSISLVDMDVFFVNNCRGHLKLHQPVITVVETGNGNGSFVGCRFGTQHEVWRNGVFVMPMMVVDGVPLAKTSAPRNQPPESSPNSPQILAWWPSSRGVLNTCQNILVTHHCYFRPKCVVSTGSIRPEIRFQFQFHLQLHLDRSEFHIRILSVVWS